MNLVNREFNVIVCGAGPAGVCAAVAAARAGAETLLIEAQGCLGGTWTASLMGFVIDAGGKSGLIKEIENRLDARKAINYRAANNNYTFDIEQMKLVLEQMCIEAGVEILLHCNVVSAQVNDKKIARVVTESKSGRVSFKGKNFIDCTGDGDLAAAAGCGFEIGEPDTGNTQPMSFNAVLTGIEKDKVQEFIGGSNEVAKEKLHAEFRRAGIEPSYSKPTLFYISDNLFWLMANY